MRGCENTESRKSCLADYGGLPADLPVCIMADNQLLFLCNHGNDLLEVFGAL